MALKGGTWSLSSHSRRSIGTNDIPRIFLIPLEFVRVWLDRDSVGLRVLARIGKLCPGYALLLCLGMARPAQASELTLTVHCAFPPDELEELDARVRLLVHGAPPPTPESIAISCDGDAGSVTLGFAEHNRSRTISTRGAPVEHILVAIEQLLAEHPTPTEAPATAPDSVSSTGLEGTPGLSNLDAEPVAVAPDTRAADATPRARRSRTIGGVGLGVSVERWPAPAGAALGPRLDFAWGAGSWAATSFESVRFGSTPDARLLAFDALLGVAWGGPFSAQRAGAVLAFGGEWFSRTAAAEPTGQRTSSSFIVDLGLRWSETLGPAALWLGADARFRVRPPELPEPGPASLSRWSVIVSLGAALPVR